jgi:hypothetical protein
LGNNLKCIVPTGLNSINEYSIGGLKSAATKWFVATPLAVLIGRCAIIQKQKSKFSNSTRFGVACTICLHVPQVSPVATQIQALQACLNYLFDANFVLKRLIEIHCYTMICGYATCCVYW